MKRIFIFGITGMLGRYVYSYLLQQNQYEVIGICRKEIDLSDTDNFGKLRGQFKEGDVIINCAGVIPQRKGCSNLEYALVNSVFPLYLSYLCKEAGAKLIQVSTDCVFDGLFGYYNEDNESNSIDIYGKTKALGETQEDTVIRTSVIGEEKNGYSLLEWVKANKNKRILGYLDHFWSGITCLEFAKICKCIIDNNLYWQGVRHIAGARISKCDLVKMISDVYSLNVEVIPHYTRNYCDRSLVSKYESFYDVPDIKTQLEEQRNFKGRSN